MGAFCKTTVLTIRCGVSFSAVKKFGVDDLLVVVEELNNIRAQWYDIGLQLRMSVGTLDAIKKQYDDPSNCL